jgi:hypothetical protein
MCEYVNNRDCDCDWICELHYDGVNMWINKTVIMWMSKLMRLDPNCVNYWDWLCEYVY